MLHLKAKIRNGKSGLKGVGNLFSESAQSEQWNILKEEVSLPTATLSKSTLEHNQKWMDKFLEILGFQLAPHGKTTMLPYLFNMQVSSKHCWGITLATAYQTAVAHESGVKRVLMANQLVGKCNMDIISTLISKDPGFEFVCLVDSALNVEQLGRFFSERGQTINVLIEYGPDGGRTGVRNESQENSILEELENWKGTVSLIGVEFFEGVLKHEKEIIHFIKSTLSRVAHLANKKVFSREKIMITGAGTSWLDIVALELRDFERTCGLSLEMILRSGCYLIYDNGMYENMMKRVLAMNLGQSETENSHFSLLDTLKPSLKIWAYVQSIPEPNLAIIGFGKRDAAMDCGYPQPYQHYRPGTGTLTFCKRREKESWKVFNMMDQHTFMRISEGDDVKVGDILSFDIYHACTTMDKWRHLLLVDDDYNVLDVLKTEF